MDRRKTGVWILVMGVLCIALIVSIGKISTGKISALEQQIEDLRSDHASQVQMLRLEIQNIYQNVDNQLKEESSLLTGVEAVFGELNPEDHTIALTLRVVPKQITQDTAIQVSIHGRTEELLRNGNVYTGTIPVDLFTAGETPLLTITTSAGSQTQYIENVHVDGRWTEYIPSLNRCRISGDSTFARGTYTIHGSVEITATPIAERSSVRFETYVIVTQRNGEEVEREDITNDVLNGSGYPAGAYYTEEYRKNYELADSDELMIWLEATDSLGYIHTSLMHSWKKQFGAVAETIYAGERIFDAQGNLLYGME